MLPLLVAGVCADLPTYPLELGLPPEVWPSADTRCLDLGSPRETLLERARRCVREEPEDAAPLRLLGHLGDVDDLTLLEAVASHGIQVEVAIDAMLRIDEDVARSHLLRVACHGVDGRYAVEMLGQLEPEAQFLADAVEDGRFPRPDLYGETWQRWTPERIRRAPPDWSRMVGRTREPVADAELLAAHARNALMDPEWRPWGLSVLPWVGDESDLPFFVDEEARSYLPGPVADLGTTGAVILLVTDGSRDRPLDWCRAPACQDAFVERMDQRDRWGRVRSVGQISPEVAERVRRGHLQPFERDKSLPEWTVRQQRVALHRGRWAGPYVSARSSLLEQEPPVRWLADHHGHRWTLMAGLSQLRDDARRAATQWLLQADWTEQAPPHWLLREASDHAVGIGLLSEVGDADALVKGMRSADRNVARHARSRAFRARDRVPRAFDHLLGEIEAGRVLEVGTYAVDSQRARDAALAGLRSGSIDRCRALSWARWADEEMASAVRACGRWPRSLTSTPDRLDTVRGLVLDQVESAADLEFALRPRPRREEDIRPWLGTDDVAIRRVVLEHLDRVRVSEDVGAVVSEWADDDRLWAEALPVLAKVLPDDAIARAAQKLAVEDDWVAARVLVCLQRPEAAVGLLPMLRRATPGGMDIAGIASAVANVPDVYEANRELVDVFDPHPLTVFPDDRCAPSAE